MKRLAVLGATGSIGKSTLDIVRRNPHKFSVHALSANTQVDALAALCREFRPSVAVVGSAAAAQVLQQALADLPGIEILYGPSSLDAVATAPEVDLVMAAIVGAAGLESTYAAVQAGKTVLLANKESLVMAGEMFVKAVAQSGARLLPVDSEHNAIFQSLPMRWARGLNDCGVRRILLTASGGPFRTSPADRLHAVTPEEACAHPNWSMGRKISVDSATLMNKGLEVIEASFLFGVAGDRIEVVVHPQSVIHSLVEYVDGSVLAELGNPDMRTPIAHVMAYPERVESGVGGLDLVRIGRLDFEAPDLLRFPCLRLAFEALAAGGVAPAVLNAANEVAVASFLDRKIGFTDIPRVVSDALEVLPSGQADSIEALRAVDATARRIAEASVTRISSSNG